MKLRSLFLALSAVCSVALAEECQVNQPINGIYGTTPFATYFLIALAPEKVVGVNFSLSSSGEGILPDELFHKPVLGGWFGQGRVPNEESLLSVRPDLALVPEFNYSLGIDEQIARLKKLGIPACTLPLDELEDFPHAFRTAGRWLDRAERGEKMAVFFEKSLATLAQKRDLIQKPVSIFYAQGKDGLLSECRGSVHASAIELAGAVNPHICEVKGRVGMVKVDFEQVMAENPDFIITQDPQAYQYVTKDGRWDFLSAVNQKKVLLVPEIPWKWMDRPPAFTRLAAAFWTMHQVYPDVLSQAEFNVFITEFFELFFNKTLNEQELAKLSASAS